MITLFIGRFQPFHNGHLYALEQINKEADKIIIGIGSSQYQNTKENPFSAEQRIEMIRSTLKDNYNYEIHLIPDIHNDPKWVEHVCQIVPNFDVVYTGNPHTKMLFEKAGFKVKGIEILPGVSGTIIRDKMVTNQDYSHLVPTETLKIIKIALDKSTKDI